MFYGDRIYGQLFVYSFSSADEKTNFLFSGAITQINSRSPTIKSYCPYSCLPNRQQVIFAHLRIRTMLLAHSSHQHNLHPTIYFIADLPVRRTTNPSPLPIRYHLYLISSALPHSPHLSKHTTHLTCNFNLPNSFTNHIHLYIHNIIHHL